MADVRYPIVMVNRMPVVITPQEIDVSNGD